MIFANGQMNIVGQKHDFLHLDSKFAFSRKCEQIIVLNWWEFGFSRDCMWTELKYRNDQNVVDNEQYLVCK